MHKRVPWPVLVAAACLAAVPALAQDQGDPLRGLVYAEANCAECHEIRPGHYESPVLEAPTFGQIAQADGMSEIALYAFFRTPHRSMPNLVVPPDHVADLTAYLLSLRNR